MVGFICVRVTPNANFSTNHGTNRTSTAANVYLEAGRAGHSIAQCVSRGAVSAVSSPATAIHPFLSGPKFRGLVVPRFKAVSGRTPAVTDPRPPVGYPRPSNNHLSAAVCQEGAGRKFSRGVFWEGGGGFLGSQTGMGKTKLGKKPPEQQADRCTRAERAAARALLQLEPFEKEEKHAAAKQKKPSTISGGRAVRVPRDAVSALRQGLRECARTLGMTLRDAEMRDVDSIAPIHCSFEKEMSLFENSELTTFTSLNDPAAGVRQSIETPGEGLILLTRELADCRSPHGVDVAGFLYWRDDRVPNADTKNIKGVGKILKGTSCYVAEVRPPPRPSVVAATAWLAIGGQPGLGNPLYGCAAGFTSVR
jgi:hypothetical protein